MKKSLFLLTVGLAVPFLFSCSVDETEIPLESITLDKTSVTMRVGEETRIVATQHPDGAIKNFIWSSSNENSVYVLNGNLHAYSVPKDGNDVIITVSNKDKTISASCSVHVDEAPPADPVDADGINVSAQRIDLEEGATIDVTATVSPLNVANKNVKWSTKNNDGVIELKDITQPDPESATFEGKNSSKVTVKALKGGSATIVAKDDTEEFEALIPVAVTGAPESVLVSGLEFQNDELSVAIGSTTQNTLTVLPWNAEDDSVTYTATNGTGSATVNEYGVVTGVSEGDVTIRATANDGSGIYAEYTVHVIDHEIVNYIAVSTDNVTFTNYEITKKSGSDTEYVIYNIELSLNNKFYFKIGDEYYKEANLKNYAESNYLDDADDGYNNLKVLVTGTYTMYVETESGPQDHNNICVYCTPSSSANKAQIILGGDTPIDVPLNVLKDDDNGEFVLEGISLPVGSKIRIYANGHLADIKSGGCGFCFSAKDSEGYVTCTTASLSGKFTFYVKFLGNNQGIYIIDHYGSGYEGNIRYIYNLNDDNKWCLNDNAVLYAWAFEGTKPGRWYKGNAHGETCVTFEIPDNCTGAEFVRLSGEITGDLNQWNSIDSLGKWNRVNGTTSLSKEELHLNLTFGAWPE